MHLTTKSWAAVAFMAGAVMAQSQSMWGRCMIPYQTLGNLQDMY